VPVVTTTRKQNGGRARSLVAETLRVMERIELAAERDMMSVLGAKRTSHNLTYFVILYSAVLCVVAAFRAHLRGVEYHLGRQYFLSGDQLRLVGGMELVGVLASLAFVALFGRRAHKPLLMCCGALVCAVGQIVCPVPYFVESVRDGAPLYNVSAAPGRVIGAGDLAANASSQPAPDRIEYFLAQLCPSTNTSDSRAALHADPCVALNSTASSTYGSLAYSTVAVGILLHGVGSGMLVTTGFIYVDENVVNKAVAVYFGESRRHRDQGRRSHRIIGGGHKRRLGVWGPQRGPGAEPR